MSEGQLSLDQSGTQNDVSQISSSSSAESARKGTTCCLVRLKTDKLVRLIKMYHRKHWLDRKGDSIPSLCFITKVKVADDDPEKADNYRTRSELQLANPERRDFSVSDLQSLPELHPPDIMPNGNVGTPTKDFLVFIKECRLPPSVINKLGLSFPKTRTNRKYGSVPFDYMVSIDDVDEEEDFTVLSGTGHELVSAEGLGPNGLQEGLRSSAEHEEKDKDAEKHLTKRELRKQKKRETRSIKKLMRENIEEKMIGQEDDSNEDNDSCEEWERHEAFTDDPSNQERNSERLFEEEIELKWEKGGSGLVFYTDAQHWKQLEGDFDEQTADDLDVDMSGYYEDGAGDLDARDFLTLRQEKRRRDGIENTDRNSAGIGKFEKHTKGIGRKVLERQGWKDGHGLGSTITGITDALDNEGQHPRDKKGFGYRGEKLVHFGINNKISSVPRKRQFIQGEVLISTKYDDPDVVDPQEKLLRRNDHYGLKHRDRIADS